MGIYKMKIYRKLAATTLAVIGAIAISGSAALAQANDNTLMIDGMKISTKVAAPKGSPLDELISGWNYALSETQQMQADDFENPAFAAVERGEEL